MLTKQEIIKELQKYAKENGGKTPGEKIIKDELGIPKWDWISYWTKVTDIQREAGLLPQIFDKTKYSKKDLCDEFIKLIREKMKWPSRDELDFKRRQDPDFPASGTFYSKLGLKCDLAKNILKFIDDEEEYKDVLDICNTVLEKCDNTDELDENGTEKTMLGWVYLIKHGSRKEYRIGKATNLLRRLGQNRIELPEKIIPIHSIETADITGVETYWLNRFKPKAMNGDWFKLRKADVNEFKRWKKIV